MNTKLMIGATLALSFLAGTTAMADQIRINAVVRDYRLSRPDAAAVVTVSSALHFRERDVVDWARDCRRSVRDVGPAYVISYYTHEPVEDVWRDRLGRDWYDYGIDCGVNWDRFNRLDISYRDFNRMVWLNLSNRAYGCDEPLWTDLSDEGLGFNDLIIVIVLGDGYRDRCDYYAYQYRHHNRNWSRWWTSADRDPHLWVGYRDDSWRTVHRVDRDEWDRDRQREFDRVDQARTARERQIRDQQYRDRQRELDRQDQARAARDRQIRDQQYRDRQRELDRQDQARAARDKQIKEQLIRERQAELYRQSQARAARDRQLRDQQIRDRQREQDRQDQIRAARERQIRDQQIRDRQREQDRQDQIRATREKQIRDQQVRDRKDNRDNGRGQRNKGNDRSQGKDKRSRDRDNSDNRGR